MRAAGRISPKGSTGVQKNGSPATLKSVVAGSSAWRVGGGARAKKGRPAPARSERGRPAEGREGGRVPKGLPPLPGLEEVARAEEERASCDVGAPVVEEQRRIRGRGQNATRNHREVPVVESVEDFGAELEPLALAEGAEVLHRREVGVDRPARAER